MKPKHSLKSPSRRALDFVGRHRRNIGLGVVGTTVAGLVAAWMVPKMLDASWGRLCALKSEADQVPALVLTVSNLSAINKELAEDSVHLNWRIYNLSNRVNVLERQILTKYENIHSR